MSSSCGARRMAPAGRITGRVAIHMMTLPAVFLSASAPAMLGVLLSLEKQGEIPILPALLLILIPSLMNASVNVLNDYYDYVRGNDTAENIVSEDDGPLAYHQVRNPAPALVIGLGLLAAAVVPGIYIIWRCGPLPALIGAAGAVILLTYSCGRLPTSYLPIGEVLSGFTLGGLVPLGVYAALTGEVDGLILYKSVPMMLIVAEFMLVNNACDLVRDRAAGRRTLPILIGTEAAQKLANVTEIFWMLQMVHVVVQWYPKGLPVLVAALIVCGRGIRASFSCRRSRETKREATAAVALTALGVAVGYPLSVAVSLFFLR